MAEREIESRWRHASPPEWVAAFLGTALVLLVLGYTLYEALTRRSRPPLLSVRTDSVVVVPSGYLLMFTAFNAGDETAMDVQVRGTLRRGEVVLEESEVTIDFVSLDAERQGGLLFVADPRRASLELRATGFDLP